MAQGGRPGWRVGVLSRDRHAQIAGAAGGRSVGVRGRPAGLSRFSAMSATVGTAEIGPAHLPRVDVEAFILANMPLVPVPSIAGISLHTAQPSSGLWRLLGQGGGGGHWRYWAYPWAGGAALDRHFLPIGKWCGDERARPRRRLRPCRRRGGSGPARQARSQRTSILWPPSPQGSTPQRMVLASRSFRTT